MDSSLQTKDYDSIPLTEISSCKPKQIEEFSWSQSAKNICTSCLMVYLLCVSFSLMFSLNILFATSKYHSLEMNSALGTLILIELFLYPCISGIVNNLIIFGSKAYHLGKARTLGYIIHQTYIFGFAIICAALSILYLICDPFFHYFIADPLTRNYVITGTYSLLPYSFANMFLYINMSYLNIVADYWINYIIVVFGLISHLLWTYLFINVLDLEMLGAGLAINLSFAVMSLSSFCYIYIFKPHPESYFRISKESFKGSFKQFLSTLETILCQYCTLFNYISISLFAMKMNKINYNIFVYVDSLVGYISLFAESFTDGIIFEICRLLVKGKIESTKKVIKMIWIIGLFLHAFVSIIISIISIFVFRYYATLSIIYEQTLITFIIYIYLFFTFMVICIFSGIFKSLNRNWVYIFSLLPITLILQPALCYVSFAYLKYQLIGFYLAIAFGFAIEFFILLYFYSKENLRDRFINANAFFIQENLEFNKIFKE